MFDPDSEIQFSQNVKQLTPEYLQSLSTIEIEATGNFNEVLSQFNTDNKLNLQPRAEGYHITIIGPTESKLLSALTPDQLENLQRINSDIQHGMGVEVSGIGFIDGSQRENLRAADKPKKALYMALNMPALQEFRQSLGLPRKDFHITLGFENGDIHMHVAGKDAKGKDTLQPISKTADPKYQKYTEQLQGLHFGSLSGKEKDKPKS